MKRLALPLLALLAATACTAPMTLHDPDTDDPDVTTPSDVPAFRSMSAWAGECWGLCIEEIQFDGAEVRFIGSNWDGTIYVDNAGTLTVDGLASLRSLEADLAAAKLEPVYGCPDCNDGGGVTLERAEDGTTTTTDYPWGSPPDELDAADAFFFELLPAMRECSETELFVPGATCFMQWGD